MDGSIDLGINRRTERPRWLQSRMQETKKGNKGGGNVRLKGNNGMGEETKETEMDWEIRGMEMNQGKKRRDANEYELEETKE